MSALAWTLGLGILAPVIIGGAIYGFFGSWVVEYYSLPSPWIFRQTLLVFNPPTLLIQLLFAALFSSKLYRNLSNRSFAFQQGG